ncbi:MAG: hypothetical protein N2450_03255 [bacterium]|nr:hypothetical protein [bacterium]
MGKLKKRKIDLLIYFTVFFFSCSSGIHYYQSYQPKDYPTLLVLLPKGSGANVIGKVLDRLENPPFRIITFPESECLNRTETEKMYRLIHRVNLPIAITMAKQVQATLVLFEDPDFSDTSTNSLSYLERQSSEQQEFIRNNTPTFKEDNSKEIVSKLRIAIVDVQKEAVIWHEVLSSKPSEKSISEFANRLITPFNK